MSTRPPAPSLNLTRRSRILLSIGAVLAVIAIVFPYFNNLFIDWLWFGSVGARGVFSKMLVTRLVLFLSAAVVVGAIVFLAGFLAFRSRPVFMAGLRPNDPLARYRGLITSRTRLFAIVPAVMVGLIAGLTAQSRWQEALLFVSGEDFGVTDPEFGIDISFYAFELPLYRTILTWLLVAVFVAFLVSAIAHYVFGGIRLGDVHGKGSMTRAARGQLMVLAGVFVLLKAFAYWLDRYELMYVENSIFTGAGYTSVNALLPAKLILLVIAVIVAASFFAAIFLRDLRIPAMATALMVLSAVLIGGAWPLVLEQFSVKPNRAEKEQEYIARNIAATKQAYGLDSDRVTIVRDWAKKDEQRTDEDRRRQEQKDADSAAEDIATLVNLRIQDPAILAATFTQQRQLKNFYGFPATLHVDRYPTGENGAPEAYVVAAREMNLNALSGNQTDWINRHLVYTHGNGFIAAPASQVDSVAQDLGSQRGGYPKYVTADLAALEREQQEGERNKEADRLRIRVDQPRVYFGPVIADSGKDYAIVGANGGQAREYDADGKTYTYSGKGGVGVGGMVNRLVFALRYSEPKILLSGDIGGDSEILFNRDPRDRVHKVAPWLTTDSTVYPVVLDGRIKWIVDGYTTLDNFPYAQRTSLEDLTVDSLAVEPGQRRQAPRKVSYIRNSVKAVVDAYDGSVDLYAFDEKDPVLKAWRNAFPGVVKARAEIGEDLMSHIRYPEDLFKVQRELLAKYHVDDPRVFFNNDAFWSVPDDPTATGDAKKLSQPPFYVVAADPRRATDPGSGPGKPVFQQISALRGLNREFLAAQIAVISDPEDYGRIIIRALPTDSQVLGPKQAQDVMVASKQISEDRALWGQSSQIKDGNLLTMPIGERGILYIEPVYTQRKNEASAFPKLLRVMLVFDGKIGYAATTSEALKQVGIEPRKVAPGQGSGAAPAPGGEEKPKEETPKEEKPTPKIDEKARDEAAGRISAALSDLKQAQKDGDFAKQGEALERLDKAVRDYQVANGQEAP